MVCQFVSLNWPLTIKTSWSDGCTRSENHRRPENLTKSTPFAFASTISRCERNWRLSTWPSYDLLPEQNITRRPRRPILTYWPVHPLAAVCCSSISISSSSYFSSLSWPFFFIFILVSPAVLLVLPLLIPLEPPDSMAYPSLLVSLMPSHGCRWVSTGSRRVFPAQRSYSSWHHA